MNTMVARVGRWLLPKVARRTLVRRVRAITLQPPIGGIEFGDLRRLGPVSSNWGFERGTVIDRYYIDRFLRRYAGDVRGRVLEIGTNEMTRRYGGRHVRQSDVLHVTESGPPVTIVGNLSTGSGIPPGAFDCILLTQTLQFVYDVQAVVQTVHRALKPGGVVLVTVPGITKIGRFEMDRWGQYWSFTTKSARLLFEEGFGPEAVIVEAAGNVLSATAFLHGIAAEELTPDELEYCDPDFETLIGIRAVRGER